ncbi:hypothetical protein SELMODRAFT_404775 [Selaginella moellendorffii]|uniref:Uncharacterized protein n=1 Tax=Selaginella moellendorffii TaxID=88036 RepID=D8QWC8_SELML|nr:hypothetical protein SELMODRAFT_404775 [Selaginella moellendorffii]
MDTQIDVGVIEAIGISAPKAATTGGGVLASDVGGGGGVVPSVAKATRGKVDELVEEVIGSIVDGSIAEAIGGIVAAPTAPQASGARGASGAFDLNMAIYNSFAEVGFGSIASTFIFSPTFPGTSRTKLVTTELEEKWDLIWLRKSLAVWAKTYDAGRNGLIALPRFVLPFELVKHWRNLFTTSPKMRNDEKHCEIRMEKVMKEKAYISQSIVAGITLEEYIHACLVELGNGRLPHGGTSSVEFKNHPGQPFLARYLKYCPGTPVYTASVLQKLLTRDKKLRMRCQIQIPLNQKKLYKIFQYLLIARAIVKPFMRQTKTFFPSLPMATDDDLEEFSSSTMHKQVYSRNYHTLCHIGN